VHSRMRNSFEFLSVSALDLFASALGVFILITFVLLPFYLKQPSLEADLRGEAVDIAAISHELDLYRERLITAQGARQDAEANLLAARQRLAAAQEATRQAAAEPKPAETPIPRKPGLLSIPALDLVIALDTTGSMRDELRDLQTSLLGIMRILYRLSPSLSIGVIAYKDYGQPYVTRSFPLSGIEERTLSAAVDFLDTLRAAGGGDNPEAVDAALEEAFAMPWRDNVQRRILVIGDAPAHPSGTQRAFDLADRFQSKGGSVGTIFTGTDEGGRLFFERLAAAGGGDFRRHKGEMIESVLFSVLDDARRQ
jgi:hypothetical protein